jgi:hypothetical protein
MRVKFQSSRTRLTREWLNFPVVKCYMLLHYVIPLVHFAFHWFCFVYRNCDIYFCFSSKWNYSFIFWNIKSGKLSHMRVKFQSSRTRLTREWLNFPILHFSTVFEDISHYYENWVSVYHLHETSQTHMQKYDCRFQLSLHDKMIY